jgi:hypothetical protein
MNLFRNYDSLCSLFLTTLQEWGAESVDWSLLDEEEFVDMFLRNLCADNSVESEARLQACSLLLQPSPGGLLAAAALKREGRLVGKEFSDFTSFTLRGSGNGWKPLCWNSLIEVLEDIAFCHEPAWSLASLMSRGWVARDHQSRFFRRVWQTCRISIQQKNDFFRWLYGQHQWSDLPKAPSSYPDEVFSLKVAYRLSSSRRPYSARRKGHYRRRRERGVGG